MDSEFTILATELSKWFESVLELTERAVFGIAPVGPHRDAVVLDLMIRNARSIHRGKLDLNGALYQPLCLFLAAACRHLRTSLGTGHWRAALDNICQLQKQRADSSSESETLGLNFGTPAELFKEEFEEAIRQAGLTEGTSFLNKEERQVALGLAVNWGIRLLLAYAMNSPKPTTPSNRKDFPWLAGQVQHAVAACGPKTQSP